MRHDRYHIGIHFGMLTIMPSEQIAVRVPCDDLAAIDALVESGVFPSRAEFVRRGAALLLKQERDREIDRRIVEAYTRMPQTEEEIAGAEGAMRRSIMEEPW